MARTRSTIKTIVALHTGLTSKDTLMNYQCDAALKIAVSRHPFRDTISVPTALTIIENATTVSLSSITDLAHIISARIFQASGTLNSGLILKPRGWWDKTIVNPEDNQKGWPRFCFRQGTSLLLDRPADSGLTLVLRVSKQQSFAGDSTECPVSILDIFVEKYVTAMVFLSVENAQSYMLWKSDALGPLWDSGRVGGELLNAINTDKYEIGEERRMSRHTENLRSHGTAIQNLISGDPNYGNVEMWT